MKSWQIVGTSVENKGVLYFWESPMFYLKLAFVTAEKDLLHDAQNPRPNDVRLDIADAVESLGRVFCASCIHGTMKTYQIPRRLRRIAYAPYTSLDYLPRVRHFGVRPVKARTHHARTAEPVKYVP